jgi:EthD domain
MDIKLMDQGLLKRKPSLTAEQFSTHWFTKHAPLVVPFFLALGVTHYEQVRFSMLPPPSSC